MTSIDRHQLAAVSIVGSFFDVVGAMYLAYDILGGKQGPLRTLTRAVTYGVLFGVGFGWPLGLVFGLATGITHGITLAFELRRASRQAARYPLWGEAICSAIRGAGYAVGASTLYGMEFGLLFGSLTTLGQIGGYALGWFPGMNYHERRAPRVSPILMVSAAVRSLGYGAAGYVSAAVAHHQMHAIMFGVDVGVTVGIVTALASILTPFIEWMANNLPDKRLGVAGVVLILIGFSLQSVQYWAALLDVTIR